MKQTLDRTQSSLDERTNCLDDRQRELETLNHLVSRLQIDYERSKNELSAAHDNIMQLDMANQTLRQHLTDKTNEVRKNCTWVLIIGCLALRSYPTLPAVCSKVSRLCTSTRKNIATPTKTISNVSNASSPSKVISPTP